MERWWVATILANKNAQRIECITSQNADGKTTTLTLIAYPFFMKVDEVVVQGLFTEQEVMRAIKSLALPITFRVVTRSLDKSVQISRIRPVRVTTSAPPVLEPHPFIASRGRPPKDPAARKCGACGVSVGNHQ